MAAAIKSFPPEMLDTLNIYSGQHVRDELCKPILRDKEKVVLPLKYMYIRKLIPVVLDLNKVEYTCWSNPFRKAAKDYNLLHYIDSTVPAETYNQDHITYSTSIDAVVLSWIYATISPYLLDRLVNQLPDDVSAMNAWECLRDMCHQQPNTTMQNKKRRSMHADLYKNYQGGKDDINNRVDLISTLPDDLLVYMLSLVADMKTVVRTCLLSKRWTHVWTQLTELDFNNIESYATVSYTRNVQPEMDKFVERVNRIIIANRAPYLDTFRIKFPLHTSYASHIDNWLKFALDKEVRNLDLNFLAMSYSSFNNLNISINPSLNLNTTLKSLRLSSVTIKVEWILNNCLNLQHLSLHRCNASTDDDTASSKHHRKLVVSSPQLKHLEFFFTSELLNIKVLHLSAPNLTSLILYEPYEINVEYHSVPSLVDATFGGLYYRKIFHHVDPLPGFSSQLEKLSILWNTMVPSISRLPTFVNIKQLEIIVFYGDDDLILLTSFIEACPLMHTLKLKLTYGKDCGRVSLAPNDARIQPIRSHQHLKVVEYNGYAGCNSAGKLACCLTWYAPMLRRFILDTRQPQFIGNSREIYRSSDQMDIIRSTTEMLAKQLQRRQQHHVDVVIL